MCVKVSKQASGNRASQSDNAVAASQSGYFLVLSNRLKYVLRYVRSVGLSIGEIRKENVEKSNIGNFELVSFHLLNEELCPNIHY